MALIIVFFGGLFYFLIKTTLSSFVPNEDLGIVFCSLSLPPASSMERTVAIANRIDSIARKIPQTDNTMRIVEQNFIAGTGSSYGMVILKLKT